MDDNRACFLPFYWQSTVDWLFQRSQYWVHISKPNSDTQDGVHWDSWDRSHHIRILFMKSLKFPVQGTVYLQKWIKKYNLKKTFSGTMHWLNPKGVLLVSYLS